MQVRDTVDQLLDIVAPRPESEIVVESMIDHILNVAVRGTYSYESEIVANEIVDELITRACKGYYGGSGATWDIRVRNARSGEEWRTVVPAVVVKVRHMLVCVCVLAPLHPPLSLIPSSPSPSFPFLPSGGG